MTFYYSPKEKAQAIKILVETLGNTRRASEETGIPERTIQRCKYEWTATSILTTNDLEESLETIIRGRYIQIRNHLIDHVQRVSAQMTENPETSVDLIMHYVRLLDRLARAEELCSARNFQLIILWEDPEGFVKLSNDIDF